MFRKIIEATGGIDAPNKEKHGYRIVEFDLDSGTFEKKIIKQDKTNVRLLDDHNPTPYEISKHVISRENAGADEWSLVNDTTFRKLKDELDKIRQQKKLPVIDDDGNIIGNAHLSESVDEEIDEIHKKYNEWKKTHPGISFTQYKEYIDNISKSSHWILNLIHEVK